MLLYADSWTFMTKHVATAWKHPRIIVVLEFSFPFHAKLHLRWRAVWCIHDPLLLFIRNHAWLWCACEKVKVQKHLLLYESHNLSSNSITDRVPHSVAVRLRGDGVPKSIKLIKCDYNCTGTVILNTQTIAIEKDFLVCSHQLIWLYFCAVKTNIESERNVAVYITRIACDLSLRMRQHPVFDSRTIFYLSTFHWCWRHRIDQNLIKSQR